MKTMQLKLCGCLFILVAASHSAQAQKTFGGKTEGGGPGGSPDTNCPCWRYPIRAIGYRKIDLRPLFAWWRENYGAYQAAVSAATKADQPPDFSSLQPSPAPGWQRIKEAHFIANVAYGWECQGVVEDVPSHSVTNKIIIRNPPTADKAKWDNLVAQYRGSQGGGDAHDQRSGAEAEAASLPPGGLCRRLPAAGNHAGSEFLPDQHHLHQCGRPPSPRRGIADR